MSIEKIRKFNIQGITKAIEMYEMNKDKFKIEIQIITIYNELVSDADLTKSWKMKLYWIQAKIILPNQNLEEQYMIVL